MHSAQAQTQRFDLRDIRRGNINNACAYIKPRRHVREFTTKFHWSVAGERERDPWQDGWEMKL